MMANRWLMMVNNMVNNFGEWVSINGGTPKWMVYKGKYHQNG